MIRWASPERLARASSRRPWLVVGLWAALFMVAAFLVAGIGDVLTSQEETIVETESDKADRLLEERLRGPEPANEFVIVQSETATVDDSQFEAFAAGLLADIRGLDVVESATSFYESADPRLVSADRRITLLPVRLVGDIDDAEDNVETLVDLVHEATAPEGFGLLTAGFGSTISEMHETAEEDLRKAEIFGLPVALIVLVLVFGAAVAATVPLGLAILSIVAAVGAAALVGRAFDLSVFITNITVMIGLAVGIDYSLLILQRFREERHSGLDKVDAIARAGATAGRTVLFSGMTVVVALLGMVIFPHTLFRSLGIGAILAVVFGVLSALTFLPAILSLLGDRVNKLAIPFLRRTRYASDGGGFWARSASIVMRRPVISVVITAAVLLAAAAPFATINVGEAGISALPRDTDTYRAFAILDEHFSAGLMTPTEIVIDAADVNAPEVQNSAGRLLATLATDDAFGAATIETNQAGDLALISVPVAGDWSSDETIAAVKRLRNDYVPEAFADVDAEVLVTGESAEDADYNDIIKDYTPLVIGFVLGFSFLLLLVVFRSLVVPLKAVIMNLLSVGAAYGLLVLVFQYGVGADLLGFQETETIENWVPLFLFCVLFGLSMDYHVFLLSRIRERFGQTGDNAESVAFGIRSTGAIITGAALIMVAVFSAFATGDLVMFQQLGFGLAVAVILDATIIRLVLVPAAMKLVGDLNWYLPRWLGWLPKIHVESPGPANLGAMSRRARQ